MCYHLGLDALADEGPIVLLYPSFWRDSLVGMLFLLRARVSDMSNDLFFSRYLSIRPCLYVTEIPI